ncbi:b138 [Murid betaherpesvirus 8]|uniref:B138 n=3 Tax=Muromegalovirus TaxID=10365 RepID=K7YNS3_RCMVE|nr:e138 [Murid betaherpesvirus 8]AAO45426.1 ORF HJ6 [Murid betaherpesvirus 2]AKE44292.1 a138 [Rat cytomegalovirus ALL-03]AFX83442.1 e138 [Murid betaherpesvirus 8]AKB93321.1 b138 [Murid betaherpesvirus 8]WEG71914.1 membrane protein m138 [Murid betaherpesvirus 8]
MMPSAMLFSLICVTGLIAVDGKNKTGCEWTFPTKENLKFSVNCNMVTGERVMLERVLCTDPDTEPKEKHFVDAPVVMFENDNGTSIYVSEWTYGPSLVGTYVTTLQSGYSKVVSSTMITPIVSITAVRRTRISKDIVTCTVEGIFQRGTIQIAADGQMVAKSDFTGPGVYVNTETVKFGMKHRDDKMIFVLRRWVVEAEKTYQCSFRPFSCTQTGLSRKFLLSHSALNVATANMDAIRMYPYGVAIENAKICCSLVGPIVQQISWYRSGNCGSPSLIYQYKTNSSIDIGSKPTTLDNVKAFYVSGIPKPNEGYVILCLQSFKSNMSLVPDVPVPPGEYQCQVDYDSPIEQQTFEKSITIQDDVDVKVIHGQKSYVVICTFPYYEKGRFYLENASDGKILFTTSLVKGFDRHLGDTAKVRFYNNTIAISVNVSTLTMFKCRISTDCTVISSKSAYFSEKSPNVTVKQETTSQQVTVDYTDEPLDEIDDVKTDSQTRNWKIFTCAFVALMLITVNAVHFQNLRHV